MLQDVLKNAVQITFDKPDGFNVIRETLTRIGIASNKEKTLYQSCHILHKKGNYYILHFKELFMLDGKMANMEADDYSRRNLIANLIVTWGLAKALTPIPEYDNVFVKIIPFKEKNEWKLVSKYNIGVKK